MVGSGRLVGQGIATTGFPALLRLAGAALSAGADHSSKPTCVTVVDADGVIRALSTGGFSEEAMAATLAARDELGQAPLRASRRPP